MDPTLRTVPAMLHHWATTDPDTPAFIFVDATGGRCELSRADVFRFSSRYAATLRRQGVQQGTVVVNTLPNSPERLLTDLGVVLAGGVAMNGQLFLADGEDFVGSLQDSSAFAVILDPRKRNGAKDVLEKRAHCKLENGQVTCPKLPALKRVFEVDFDKDGSSMRPLFQLIEKEPDSYVADVRPRDTAVIFTTSGSTGFSKLVPASQENVLTLGDRLCQLLDYRPGEVIYNDWSQGWAIGFPSMYLACGVTRVLVDTSRDLPDDLIAFKLDVIHRERCTAACLAPCELLQLSDLWHRLDKAGLRPPLLRVIASGGQPFTKKHMEVIGKVTAGVLVLYGSTEASSISSKFVTDKNDYEDCNNGTPTPGSSVRVVNEDLQDQPVGQMGQILMRSLQLFDGYLNNEQATQRAFTNNGWFKTGDVGYFNTKGEIFTVCRESYSIIRGSFLLYPGWLEKRIRQCPGVKEVLVVPVPDPTSYQELCACVVPYPGAQLTSEGLTDFCKTLFLTSEKSEMTAVPKHVLFFDAFPTTHTGKTSRRATEAVARRRLGLDEDTKSCKKANGQR